MRRRNRSIESPENIPLQVLVGLVVCVASPLATADRVDLEGNWLQLEADIPEVQLTAAGEAAIANYVPLRDDPDFQCNLNTLSTPYPQSTQMRTEARFTADIDRLHVDILHTDPVIYREPFVMSFEFIRVDFEVLEFGCTIEAASYEDRL